jgi:hypothetical protein
MPGPERRTDHRTGWCGCSAGLFRLANTYTPTTRLLQAAAVPACILRYADTRGISSDGGERSFVLTRWIRRRGRGHVCVSPSKPVKPAKPGRYGGTSTGANLAHSRPEPSGPRAAYLS